jgi:chromosomal replication initiator protein
MCGKLDPEGDANSMATVDRALWQKIIQQVVAEGGHLIRPWFTQLEPESLDHGLLEVRTPGATQQAYCEQHVSRLFTEAAQAATGRLVSVEFLAGDHDDTEPVDVVTIETPAPAVDEPMRDKHVSMQYDEYTFDEFVMGPCNRLAHAACLAISDSPGKTYNPLFLHGDVGLGKTHLIQASCFKVRQDNPGATVCFLSSEAFVNYFIEAVEKGELNAFRHRFRHADILAIDDIQFLARHEQIQEEFFHTFNELFQAQKQIILSSDRSPSEIPQLEERLVSRFNWGLVARIDKPGYETRMAILRKKAAARHLQLPDEVTCYIASAIDSNTRELEGAISKVAMLAQVYDRPITIDLAAEALGADSPDASGRDVSIEEILHAVTEQYNVRLADLQSKKRTRSIAFPRQICMYLARQLTRHSLGEIGGYFGGRDHTTVMHANKQIENLMKTDPQLQATVERLKQDLRQ